eukprot:6002852-Prymnesium_polylepis.3
MASITTSIARANMTKKAYNPGMETRKHVQRSNTTTRIFVLPSAPQCKMCASRVRAQCACAFVHGGLCPPWPHAPSAVSPNPNVVQTVELMSHALITSTQRYARTSACSIINIKIPSSVLLRTGGGGGRGSARGVSCQGNLEHATHFLKGLTRRWTEMNVMLTRSATRTRANS